VEHSTFRTDNGSGRLSPYWRCAADYFFILGTLIASILEFFNTNPRFAELAGAAGFADLASANGFAAALFGLLAIPTGLYAATRLGRLVADERARRWTAVFATDVSRIHLVGDEIVGATMDGRRPIEAT
jgi:polyether ionophore transport system permease protein